MAFSHLELVYKPLILSTVYLGQYISFMAAIYDLSK